MNAALPFPQPETSGDENSATTFRVFFWHAPFAAARCDHEGLIIEMNPAFRRNLPRGVANRRSLRLGELVRPQDRENTESLLRDLLNCRRESVVIDARCSGSGADAAKWTAWRQPGHAGEPDHALLVAEPYEPHNIEPDHIEPAKPESANGEPRRGETYNPPLPSDESALQNQRWEAIGRLTGGVVHDFNNLLTGVMLYCDLLLASLDSLDRRRRYAEEIRAAIVQAATLVRQLLVFARPQPAASDRPLSLNEVTRSMQNLLRRLIGENIVLDLRLDPDLGAVKIDQAQAQQILLNLVLNARDALPNGGRITVETGNCKFQQVAGDRTQPPFPCVLLIVADDGQGMSAETRRRLFEPFFTTKNSGQGTGLGLTTVRSIVAANRGLIHFESEPGRGTRAMVLLPRSCLSAEIDLPDSVLSDSVLSDSLAPDSWLAPSTPQEIKKETLL